jgi:tryptophan halogenase
MQDSMSNPIKSVLIVGGGTAGWMTAAFLSRFLDASRCSITLVESATIGTIGVGEATVPPLVAFLRMMGIDEDDFLRQCHATYKLGIKFIDWNGHGPGVADQVWHPFGQIGPPLVEGLPVFHHWLRNHRQGRDSSAYTSYSLQALLGDMGCAPRSLTQPSPVIRQGAYAYHLDAKAFAGYLARIATARNVRALVDDVRSVALDERGLIKHVDTAANGALAADFYIDCSGFTALLAEKALGDPWIDWSPYLLCDRAVVLPLPHDGATPRMAPYTQATALSAGWMWRIPLDHRTGCGYVYSSRFISDDRAAAELVERSGQGARDARPAHLRMRVGRRANFWAGNCLSMGLAAGFLEPLESTGIYLVQKGIELFLDHFPDAECSPALAAHYNRQLGVEFEQVRDFIVLHYLLNRRQHGEFWPAARNARLPDSLAHTLDYYDATGLLDWDSHSLFREPSFYAMAAGFGRLPRAYHAMAGQVDAERAWQALLKVKSDNLALARALPDHGDLIRSVNAARRN